MSKGRSRSHYLKRLERRADYLDERIEAAAREGRDLTWDRAELAALDYVLDHFDVCRPQAAQEVNR